MFILNTNFIYIYLYNFFAKYYLNPGNCDMAAEFKYPSHRTVFQHYPVRYWLHSSSYKWLPNLSLMITFRINIAICGNVSRTLSNLKWASFNWLMKSWQAFITHNWVSFLLRSSTQTYLGAEIDSQLCCA